jgi:hypothetical protein
VVDLLQAVVDVVKCTYPKGDYAPLPASLSPSDQAPQSKVERLKATRAQIQKSPVSHSTGYGYDIVKDYPVVPKLDPTLSGSYWSFSRIRILPRFEGIDPVPMFNNVIQ